MRLLKWVLDSAHQVGAGLLFEILMPFDARVVAVRWYRGAPTLWTESLNERTTVRRFYVVLTGDEAPLNGRHVGTVVTPDEMFVYHVYEEMQ